MLKRHPCAVIALVGSIAAVTTASFSWWAAPPISSQSTVTAGALILDGAEVPAPYLVTIDGQAVKVNNHIALEYSQPQRAGQVEHDLATKHGVLTAALDQYAIIRNDLGREAASNGTLDLLKSSNLVASAKSLDPEIIEVLFKGEQYPEIIELSYFDVPDIDPETSLRILDDRRRAIEDFLRQDRLVVLVDGILVATEPGTADAHMDVVREASKLPLAQRRELLQTVIPDSLAANLVADRLQVVGGEEVRP